MLCRHLCQTIIEDAIAGGITLPAPYDQLGPARFLVDLAEPDQLGDDALEWLIDLPAAGVDVPRGLRFHTASKPISPAPVLRNCVP